MNDTITNRQRADAWSSMTTEEELNNRREYDKAMKQKEQELNSLKESRELERLTSASIAGPKGGKRKNHVNFVEHASRASHADIVENIKNKIEIYYYYIKYNNNTHIRW